MTPHSSMHIEAFFDPATATVSYLVLDRISLRSALLDTVLDYDPATGRTSTVQADRMIARVLELGATIDWLLETHVHADHLSAASYIAGRLGGRIGIGAEITRVQDAFGTLFNAEPGFARDGSQFDHLFTDAECFSVGELRMCALHTPGHTPACLTYVVEDAAFVGDTLFMPDYGTARSDFPGGDARTLYRSIRRVLELPPKTRLFVCHDYLPEGRELRYQSTVAEQRQTNIHVRDGISEDAFVAMRLSRDATLEMPLLMLPSVQINMRAGALPPAEGNGVHYLKIPINAF